MAATKKYVDDEIAAIPAASDLTPAGTVIWTARSSAPTGYLKANGAAVSRSTYATLFSAIGTIYGAGDGSTTFNLPDLRGEFIRGWDDGRGVDSGRAMGSNQAFSTSASDLSVSPSSHSHSYSDETNSGTGGGQGGGGANTGTQTLSKTTGSQSLSVVSSATETRPRSLALLACIKV